MMPALTLIRDEAYDPVEVIDDEWLGNPQIITGTRQDWSTSLGLTQILTRTH